MRKLYKYNLHELRRHNFTEITYSHSCNYASYLLVLLNPYGYLWKRSSQLTGGSFT